MLMKVNEFIYEAPQVEVVEMEVEQAILNESGMESGVYKDGEWA